MIARVALLHHHGRQVRLVEQMARKLRARAGQVGAVRAVLLQDVPDPQLRAEHEREKQETRDGKKDGHGALTSSCPALVPGIHA